MTCDITCNIEIFNHSNGQDSAAREALEWLRGTNRVDQVLIVVIKIMLRLSICKGFYLQEFYQIKRSLDESSQLSAGLGDLVKRWRKFNVGADVDVDVDVDADVDVDVDVYAVFPPVSGYNQLELAPEGGISALETGQRWIHRIFLRTISFL